MSFYPPGWDHEYLLNADGKQLMTLPDDQRQGLFDGLKATYGEEGFNRIFDEMQRRYEARIEDVKSPEQKQADLELTAPFYRTLDSVFRMQDDWAEWGFVVFRTTKYGPEHDARWAKFRNSWDQIIEDRVGPNRGLLDKVDRAIGLLKFHWVEDVSLEGASPADVSRRYDSMDLSRGLDTSACLMVTEASLMSVLDSPLPSSAPWKERQEVPFIVAVSRTAYYPRPGLIPEEEDIEEAEFNDHFNVAVEGLLAEFYPIVALDITDLYKLTVSFRHPNDIWCASDRWGVKHYNGA